MLPNIVEPVAVEVEKRLAYLGQLAAEADDLRERAVRFLGRISSSTEVCKLLHDVLKKDRLPTACGVPAGRALNDSEIRQEVELYWRSVRALIAVHFSRFTLEFAAVTDVTVERICLAARATSRDVEARAFCTYMRPTATDSIEPPHPLARAIVVLTHALIARRRTHDLSKKENEFVETLIEQLLGELLDRVKINEELAPPLLPWQLAVLKLTAIVRPQGLSPRQGEALRSFEDKLSVKLALGLQYENLGPMEVANIVYVLGGRYLNPMLHVEPATVAIYQAAVRYALKAPGGAYGAADIESIVRGIPVVQDPLATSLSAIVSLLDLPNSLLLPAMDVLAERIAETVSSLKWKMETFAARPKFGADKEAAALMDVLHNSIAIGAAVAERFRDIISDRELDTLEARVPGNVVPWVSLSDSLGFKDSIYNDVIIKWQLQKAERPGAILIFGPPGTGKTTIATGLLHKLNDELRRIPGASQDEHWRFLALSPADFSRQGADMVIAAAEKLFRTLQRIRRCVVLLDEMEEFLRVRGRDSTRESRLITTALLPLLQDTVKKREIILIVATNFVGTIDPAVTRRGRFDMILPLGPPDEKHREDIVRKTLGTANIKFTERNTKMVVKYTMGYTFDEVQDYMAELCGYWMAASRFGEEVDLVTASKLETLLWRIRQDRVPIALSGAPGCSWRTFHDEAMRYRRTPSVSPRDYDDPAYWQEPPLPGGT